MLDRKPHRLKLLSIALIGMKLVSEPNIIALAYSQSHLLELKQRGYQFPATTYKTLNRTLLELKPFCSAASSLPALISQSHLIGIETIGMKMGCLMMVFSQSHLIGIETKVLQVPSGLAILLSIAPYWN